MIDVNPNYLETVERILAEHVPECEVRAFGSRVTWTAKDYSDLDLAIVGPRALDADRLRLLKEAFEESDLPFRVDVIDWRAISASFRKVVERKYEVVQRGEEKRLGMAGEWQSMPFERLLAEPVRNGIYKPKEFHGRGTKIVNMGELFAYPRLRAVPMKRVELSDSEKERCTLSKGDLLFARRSLVAEGAGKCSVVLDLDEPTTFESSIIRARPDGGRADPLYLYYFFNSTYGLHRLDTIRRQVAVAGITGGDLARLEIPVPPLSEQRAIAHILGTLDDKIELNRRMNETLEAIARALFKSWFVDFDPVRAKAEGRAPGLPKHLANLFPDSFEESELGEIPAGWEIRGLDEIAHFLNGLALQKYPPGDGATLPVIKIAQLRKGDTEGADHCNISVPPEYVVNDGDVLFSWSGSLECVLWAGGRGALNQHLFKVTSTQVPKWFYYLWIHEHLPGFRHVAADKATTMGHIQRYHLSDAKAVVPKAGVLHAADRLVAPLIEQVMQRRVESRTLAALRDTLLPKLISGELRVKDAERFVGRRF